MFFSLFCEGFSFANVFFWGGGERGVDWEAFERGVGSLGRLKISRLLY